MSAILLDIETLDIYLHLDYLDVKAHKELAMMDKIWDLSESKDVRLVAAGRLSPTAVAIRHEREELAAVIDLGRGHKPTATPATKVSRPR
jgi:hypothetical protein